MKRLPLPGRGTVRTRLTLTYAVTFLVAGLVLLAATYVLVAHSLPRATTSSLTTNEVGKLTAQCKADSIPPSNKPAPKSSPRPAEPDSCKQLVEAGAKAATQDQRTRTLHSLLLYSGLGLIAATLLAGALGWIIAGRALRPLTLITDAARRASDQHLGERLRLAGPRDELTRLGDTFDEMLDRLDKAFTRQRRFIADASHELRTPLTATLTAIEVTLAKDGPTTDQLITTLRKVHASSQDSERIIAGLLALAAGEIGDVDAEQLDLAELARDALESLAPVAARLNITVTHDLDSAPTLGASALMDRLVFNLIDNAVRHNEANGTVLVATSSAHERAAVLTVENSGPHIPDDAISTLLQPFSRMDTRAGDHAGLGLGLAIVHAIAEAHHAQLIVTPRPEGGLTVTIKAPLARTTSERLRS